MLQNEFDLDLSGDEEFRQGFLAHIRRLSRRQESQEEIEDWYLQELQGKYPLFFEMAIRVHERIRETCGLSQKSPRYRFWPFILDAPASALIQQ